MSKISEQFQISGQFQDTFGISGISGQLDPCNFIGHINEVTPYQTGLVLRSREYSEYHSWVYLLGI